MLMLAPSGASAAWSVPPTPNVPGADLSLLEAVDCASADSCIAVGFAAFNTLLPNSHTEPLAERWDGNSWQVIPTPESVGLRDVSCPWPTFCFAAGGSSSGSLIEVWNGVRWSDASTPEIPGGVTSAISCSGIVACTAVGRVTTPIVGNPGTTDSTLALRWEGAGWHVQPTPNGAGSSRLNDVDCPLKRTCTAVGESSAGSGSSTVTSPLVTRWYGRVNAWGLQSAPQPEGAESTWLEGVSCPVAPVCVAVGHYNTHLGSWTALTERRIGPTWSVLTSPNPGTGFNGVDAVSCPTSTLCRAVGPPAWRFDGTSWQLESIPTPQVPNPFLRDISCPTRFFCMAVGASAESHFGTTLSAKWTP
jgi:hypothetical protein